jgi:two-component system sensor histidine kinase UhpB
VAGWLGLVPEIGGEQQLRIGERSLVIAPKPGSEIDERLGDTVRLLITLLLFSGASLLVAWFAADRALAPVRGLEAGLERLARGEADPALPPSRCASSRGSPAPSSASPPSCRRLAPPSAPSPAS